jgi:hypothetical protein
MLYDLGTMVPRMPKLTEVLQSTAPAMFLVFVLASPAALAQADLRASDPSFRAPVGNEAPDVRIYQPPWVVPQTPNLPVGVPQPQVQSPERLSGPNYGPPPSVQPPLTYSNPRRRPPRKQRSAPPAERPHAAPQSEAGQKAIEKKTIRKRAPASRHGARSRRHSTR